MLAITGSRARRTSMRVNALPSRPKTLAADVFEKYEKQMEERETEIFAEEAVSESFHAEITDMVCGTGMVGSYRLPKSEKTFLIIFKNDEGKYFELRVSENIYTSLEVGMKGMLTILEGQLDSFELDEE